MSWFDDVFSGGMGGAAEDMAQGYGRSIDDYKKALEQIKTLMQPFIDRGNTANTAIMNQGQATGDQFNTMLGAGKVGPDGQPLSWMDQYKQSPMAKYQTDIAMRNMENAQAAGGMIGSGPSLRNFGQLAQDMASQDQQRYFGNMMDLGRFSQGAYQPISQQGYDAAASQVQPMYQTGQAIGGANQNIGMANAFNTMAGAGGINNFLNSMPNMVSGIKSLF